MNSNFGKNFDFDLGLGSSRTTSLNDKKNKNSSYSSYSSYSSSSSAQSKPAWQPTKPSWTHQPAAAPSQPSSMVGDIFGKSWSSDPSSGIGIVDKNPNLFGDLVNSALGQDKTGAGGSNANAPLKNSTPAWNKSPFSMGNMADSLPKTNWGSTGNYHTNVNPNSYRSPNLGGPSMTSLNNTSGGGKIGSNSKDPFGSLVDFSSKPSSNPNSNTKNSKVNNNNDQGNNVFGDFQNAPKPSTTTNNTFPTSSFTFSNPSSGLNMDDFLKPTNRAAPPPPQSSSDPLGMFFSSSTTATATAPSNGLGGLQQSQSEMDDWGVGTEFGGDDGGPTTELDGLPPPPAGVNASAAKNKGMDNYKQGQYADAIKWLSWAVVLLEKAGDTSSVLAEVLSSRASCYKEVGEYKKAVADCTTALEQDEANVSVLVQRALLYESMEKYKLGAEDLRTVMKFDPGNRIARSTIHRLTKLAD